MWKGNLWAGLKRLRKINSSYSTNRRAKFSTTPHNAKVISTEEKAAEVNKAAWPTLRKYAFLIVPSILGIVLTTVVVNNVQVRYYLEDYIPSYIDFVRNYYGFSDEDYNELKRIKSMLQEEAKDVNMRVILENGQTVHMTINGLKSVDEMMAEFEINNPNCIIKNIIFEDSTVDSTSDITRSDAESATPSDSTITVIIKSIRNMLSQIIPSIVSRENEEKTNAIAINVNAQVIPPTMSCQRSHWDSELCFNLPSNSDEIIPNRYKQNDNNNNKSGLTLDFQLFTPTTDTIRWSIINLLLYPPASSHDQLIGMDRYNNIVYFQLKDMRRFLNATHLNEMTIPEPLLEDTVDKKFPQYKKLKQQQQQQQEQQQATTSAVMTVKEQVKQEIVDLEHRIAELEQERVSGTREIDVIDNEIKDINAKIIQLQRQHLNYFYYF